MFNFFKKKNVTTESITTVVTEQIIDTEVTAQEEPKIDSIFPTAKEMTQTSSANWSLLTNDQVLETLFSSAKDGERYTCFFRVIIPDTTIQELKKLGYEVNASMHRDAPYYKISW